MHCWWVVIEKSSYHLVRVRCHPNCRTSFPKMLHCISKLILHIGHNVFLRSTESSVVHIFDRFGYRELGEIMSPLFQTNELVLGYATHGLSEHQYKSCKAYMEKRSTRSFEYSSDLTIIWVKISSLRGDPLASKTSYRFKNSTALTSDISAASDHSKISPSWGIWKQQEEVCSDYFCLWIWISNMIMDK